MYYFKKVRNFLIILGSIIFFFTSSFSSQDNEQKYVKADSCEMITLKLDVVGNTFKKSKIEQGFLIIIGGKLKGEKDKHNRTRIANSIGYFETFHDINFENIIYSIGPTDTNHNYLKFFVDGKLIEEIRLGKNGKLCSGIGESFSFPKEKIKF